MGRGTTKKEIDRLLGVLGLFNKIVRYHRVVDTLVNRTFF
jgi:hypothetical protein